MLRFAIGIENEKVLLDDLSQALAKAGDNNHD